ncbi:MAG: hypothetical protein KAH86_03020 [Methanosarcinales archaeon]|nr:hypothetical protein [Methanosarcinales archaeon]
MKKQGIWIALILILVVSTMCASAVDDEKTGISPLEEGGVVVLQPYDVRIEVLEIKSLYATLNISSDYDRIGLIDTYYTTTDADLLDPIKFASNNKITRIDVSIYGDAVTIDLFSNVDLRITEYINPEEEQASAVTVPELKLRKSIDKTSMQVDDMAVISVELKNRGNGSATSIDLDELMMPDGISIEGMLPDTSGTTVAADQTRTFQYKIKATKEGNYTIQPTTVYYKSESGVNYEGTTNSLSLSVAKPPELKPLLEADIEIDNSRLYKGEETSVEITITNNGDAPANNVEVTGIVDGTPRDGIEYLEDDFESSFKTIEPGDSETYLFEPVIRARDVGSYVIKLGIDYDGGSTDATSQKIRVIKKEYRAEDFYKYAPILIIPVVLILLVFGIQFMRRYMAYRY